MLEYHMRYLTGRSIPLAPPAFDGTLRELLDQHIVGVSCQMLTK
jgi:hypothetical protein